MKRITAIVYINDDLNPRYEIHTCCEETQLEINMMTLPLNRILTEGSIKRAVAEHFSMKDVEEVIIPQYINIPLIRSKEDACKGPVRKNEVDR